MRIGDDFDITGCSEIPRQIDGFVDTNANGISDADEGMCNLYDAEGRNAIGFKASAGTLQCFTSLGGSDLPEAQMPEGGLAYGAFSFMVSDLPVDLEQPASVLITVYFPEDLAPETTWYKYDEAIQDYTDFSDHAVVDGNTMILTLTDGGDGDQDGVVNGVIIDPSGPGNVSRNSGGGSSLRWAPPFPLPRAPVGADPGQCYTSDSLTLFNFNVLLRECLTSGEVSFVRSVGCKRAKFNDS